jgi:hypothetical protein
MSKDNSAGLIFFFAAMAQIENAQQQRLEFARKNMGRVLRQEFNFGSDVISDEFGSLVFNTAVTAGEATDKLVSKRKGLWLKSVFFPNAVASERTNIDIAINKIDDDAYQNIRHHASEKFKKEMDPSRKAWFFSKLNTAIKHMIVEFG